MASTGVHTLGEMAQVLIKTRDLDSDDRAVAVVEIDRVPENPLRQEQHLAEVVRRLHPEARQRSFEDGVSSFVASQHLIVARYRVEQHGQDATPPSEVSDSATDQQDQLFAA